MLKKSCKLMLLVRSIIVIALAVFTITAATPLAAADKKDRSVKKDPDLQRAQDMINQDRPAKKGAVRTDGEKGRVSVETKSGAGVYGEAGGKPPSHDNPKGEKKVGGGVQYRFGK